MCSSTGLGCGGTHPSPELSKARVPSHLGRSHGLCDKDKLRRGLEGHPESTAKKKGRMGQEKRSQANGSSLRPRKMLSGEVGSSKKYPTEDVAMLHTTTRRAMARRVGSSCPRQKHLGSLACRVQSSWRGESCANVEILLQSQHLRG